MIDIKQKRKTIEVADISPQEEWWEKNLLEAYEEIATLRQQRDDLLTACEMAENWLFAISKRKGGLVLMVQACPYSPDNHTRRKIQAAIKKARP